MPIKATVKAVTAATGLIACRKGVVRSVTAVTAEPKIKAVPTAKLLWLISSSLSPQNSMGRFDLMLRNRTSPKRGVYKLAQQTLSRLAI